MKKDKLIKYYNNKYIRSLIQLVPFGVGSAIDVYIQESIDQIQKDRLETFFDQLESGQIELTKDIIKSEDFLHNYFSTVRIVLNTRRREKITLIGKLFNTVVNQGLINADDESYEKFLKILDELSFMDIEILKILKDLEEKKTKPKRDDKWAKLEANQNIWDEFGGIILNRFGIDSNSLDETLIRIERTGCLYLPRIKVRDLSRYCAITTNLFDELLKLIVD